MGDHHLGYNAKLNFKNKNYRKKNFNFKKKTTVPKIAQFFCINS